MVSMTRKKKQKKRRWSNEWYKLRNRLAHENLLNFLCDSEPEDYRNLLRMDLESFDYLLNLVRSDIEKKDTKMREAIPVSQRLSVALRYLSSGMDLENLKFMCAVASQTLALIIIETCSAIIKALKANIQDTTGSCSGRRYNLHKMENSGIIQSTHTESPSVQITRFICHSCKEMFSSKPLVDEHCNSGNCDVSKGHEIEQVSNKERSYSPIETVDLASASAEQAQTPPFVCAACVECFSDYQQLTLHNCARSHKKIFSCDTCGKSFATRISLASHVQVHLKKQYTCEICVKSFTSRSYLLTHMRTHTGTKPYRCSHCEKSFSQRSTLVRHMSVHSVKKPFICRSCYKHFSYRHTYVLHLQGHSIMK